MNADPAAQRRLLDLQAVDTTLAQLAHRRKSLPELAAIARVDEQLSALSDDMVRADTEVSDIAREQRRLEADVEQVRQRAERDQQRLASGAISSGGQLEKLQHEVDTLARRQSDLEDQVLELMERREEAEGTLTELRGQVEKLEAERTAAAEARDATWQQLDGEAALNQRGRDAIASDVPADLLALYEKIREQSGGIGAALLRGKRCEGCRLDVGGSELSAVRNAAPDLVVRHEECRRILVRTGESAL